MHDIRKQTKRRHSWTSCYLWS